jgi:hypothetical protein
MFQNGVAFLKKTNRFQISRTDQVKKDKITLYT